MLSSTKQERGGDSRLGSPGGNTQRAAGQGGNSGSSGNLFPPRQQGDPAEPSLLRSGSWRTGTGSEEPTGEQGGGGGGALLTGPCHGRHCSVSAPTPYSKDTSYPGRSGLFRSVAQILPGVYGPGLPSGQGV